MDTPQPDLASALVQLKKRMQRVPKSSSNEYHKYDYTSVDTMLAHVRPIMAECGLSLDFVSMSTRERVGLLDPAKPDGPVGVIYDLLVTDWLLSHTSGQVRPIHFELPSLPEKGRPEDKAQLTALSHTLRELYRMIGGVDRDGRHEDDGDSHDTREAVPRRAAPAPSPAAPSGRSGPSANMYAGACDYCQLSVPAKAGLRLKRGDKWITYHKACLAAYEAEQRGAPARGADDATPPPDDGRIPF